MSEAKSLSEFTTELKKRNIARPNLFFAEIIPPPKLVKTSQLTNLVSMWCCNASTPQISIHTNDSYLEANVNRRYAYNQDLQSLAMVFYVDQGYEIKNFFDNWYKLVVPYRRNFNYSSDYTADKLNIYILNQEDKATYQYTYSKIFPKTIQGIDLSYANGNTFSTFTVEFVYEDVFFTKITPSSSESNINKVLETSEPTSNNAFGFDPTMGISNEELLSTLGLTEFV